MQLVAGHARCEEAALIVRCARIVIYSGAWFVWQI